MELMGAGKKLIEGGLGRHGAKGGEDGAGMDPMEGGIGQGRSRKEVEDRAVIEVR